MAGKHAGHRCKAKAKRLHPVTIGSLSSHGSASGSWLPPAKCTGRCLVCGVSKSPDEPFQPGVDCCLKDWEVYLAFTHLGTFDDFVQIKSNDERIAKQIQQARQLLSKKASATWPATEVREEDEVEVNVSTPMIGPSKAQIEKWTGCTPEELGMQLLTLTDVHHNAFKGVLMPDPMRPYTCFEISSKTTVKMSQVKMPAEKQIFQEQADDSFKFCKAKRFDDDKFHKLLLTKTQTCPWTLESLFEKSDAVRKQKGLPLESRMAGMASRLGNLWAAAACPGDRASSNPTGWRTDADFDEGDAACGSMADDGADGSDVETEPPPELGSVLNPDAVHETMSLFGGTVSAKQNAQKRQRDSDDGSSSIIRASPGAKFRQCKTSEGMPVLDDDRFDLVQRRIASADVDKIFLGHAMGREIAWVKKTRDQLRSSGDEKPASMLAEHYDLCVQAEKLLEQPIAKMPKTTMELAVKELQDAGIVLPQSLQLAIFKRAVSELQNNLNEGNTELFMTTVLPWTISETGTDEVFDGLAPKLAGMGRMPLEAATMFGDGIISVA